MSPALGTLSYTVDEGYQKPFSDKTGKLIDSEVKRLIDECYEKCKTLLAEKKPIIER